MIYLLEDDQNIQKLIQIALKKEGFEVMGFEKPSDFKRALEEKIPELVLLDVMLPEEDGLTVLLNLRKDTRTKNLPIILVTAIDGEYERAKGLDLGADDYIAKPFSIVELVSRIRAVLRRTQRENSGRQELLEIKELSMNTDRHSVSVNDEEIALSFKEYQLLEILMRAKGAVCERMDLIEEVWGEGYGESRTLDVHIRHLRAKLKRAGEYIVTVKGIGYKMEV
ncbi:MAG: response regulator transcription factor [Lachnospiraceae bacterium]|nr:response regulator transcription factor [Lachnospiraceae bacterium]